MSPVSERLVRLLNMVPYFQANPRITYAEAASDLGVTEKQLRDDLNQLWMCGLPGYGPGDLIDFEFSGDTIEVTFSAGIDHPLRLTSPEATGVLVALRALVDVPGDGRPRGRTQRDREDRVRGGHGRPRRRAAAVDEPAPVGEPGRGRGPGGGAGRPGADHRVLLRLPRHADQQDRRPDPRGAGRRAQLSGGVVPVRRRACGCSGSTASSTPRCSTSRRRRPSPPSRRRRTPRCSTRTRRCRRRRCASTGRRRGCSTTTRCGCCASCPTGHCEAAMTYASDEWMARFVLGFGSGVRVLSPETLAQRVRESRGGRTACVWRRASRRAR